MPSSSASVLPESRPIAKGASGIASFAVTIFLSAFLLFQVQPLIAKLILPWFGGSAAVWTTCMLFFQMALLAGYFYAHLLTTASPRRQAYIHIALLAVSLLSLPILPSAWWKPAGTEDPLLRILGLLAATIGLPYFLLSSTSPLLQSWLSRANAGVIPYRFFALSNVGSMLALLSYPVLVEPNLANRYQAWTWSGGYALFVALCGFIAYRSRNAAPRMESASEETGPAPTLRANLQWVALAAAASALLLGVTNHLSQNVAAIPFLWIVPLTLYLLSFILCFESSAWYKRVVFLPLFAASLGAMGWGITRSFGDVESLPVTISIYCAALFVCCMTCHGELARTKPASRHLTGFYLMVSVGGALGGLFVALIAPYAFKALYEFPIAIVFAALAVLTVYYRDEPAVNAWRSKRQMAWLAGFAATAALAVGLAHESTGLVSRAVFLSRNFYGALRVNEWRRDAQQEAVRELVHGTINHGEQFLDPRLRRMPITYYGPSSGIGLVMNDLKTGPPIKVAVIGLGTGTVAAYGRAGDTIRYYEINPSVVGIARKYFTYLADSAANVDIVLGDARLSLERQEPQNFDVIAVDAFSSDSIPVHLLTREAFGLYLRHLKPDGIVAIHVSNRYLNLAPVVAQEAAAYHTPIIMVDSDDDEVADYSATTWMLASNRPGYWDRPAFRSAAARIPTIAKLRIWTDDYSNLWRILK